MIWSSRLPKPSGGTAILIRTGNLRSASRAACCAALIERLVYSRCGVLWVGVSQSDITTLSGLFDPLPDGFDLFAACRRRVLINERVGCYRRDNTFQHLALRVGERAALDHSRDGLRRLID